MRDDRLVIVDTETTGLNIPGSPDFTRKKPVDLPLQYGVGIYDLELRLHNWFEIKIWSEFHESRVDVIGLDEYVKNMHTENGLLDKCRDLGQSISDSESELNDFLHEYEINGEPMCGSSVQFDRSVLSNFAPQAAKLFHYRNIDTSTIKELCRRFNKPVYDCVPEAGKAHTVTEDIADTANELKFYVDNFCFTV